jgi:hypothetical protein
MLRAHIDAIGPAPTRNTTNPFGMFNVGTSGESHFGLV